MISRGKNKTHRAKKKDSRRSEEEEEECWALTSGIDYRVNVDGPPSKESSC
jgi:hypothetical protein